MKLISGFFIQQKKNDVCGWCNHMVKETGKVSKIEGNFVVEYDNNQETSRRVIVS